MQSVKVYIEDTQLVTYLKSEVQRLKEELKLARIENDQLRSKLIDEMQLSFRLTDEKRGLEIALRDYRNNSHNS